MLTHMQHTHKHVTNDNSVMKTTTCTLWSLDMLSHAPSSRHCLELSISCSLQLISPIHGDTPSLLVHHRAAVPLKYHSLSAQFLSLVFADSVSLLRSISHFWNRSPLQRPLCVKGLNQAWFCTNWSLARMLPTTFKLPTLAGSLRLAPYGLVHTSVCSGFASTSISLLLCHLSMLFVPMFQETKRKMPLCFGLTVATWFSPYTVQNSRY